MRFKGSNRDSCAVGSKKASKGKPGSLESPTPAAPVSTGREDTKESADAEDIKVLEELRTMSMEGALGQLQLVWIIAVVSGSRGGLRAGYNGYRISQK